MNLVQIRSLIFELQCYKCQDLPSIVGLRKNRYICAKKGHFLCDKCKKKCPCGSNVGQGSLIFVAKFLESLPADFNTCPNSKFGCSEFISVWGNHLDSCPFRTSNCPKNGCGKKMAFKDLMDHIKQNHKFPDHDELKDQKFEIKYFFPGKKLSTPIGFGQMKLSKNDDETFFLTGCVKGQNLYLWIYFHGPYNEKFKYSIKTNGNHEEFHYSGLCHDFGIDEKSILENHNVFTLGNSTVQRLKSSSGMLSLIVQFENIC